MREVPRPPANNQDDRILALEKRLRESEEELEQVQKETVKRNYPAPRIVRQHACSWPGCPKMVPVKEWACDHHWYTLPRRLRAKILSAYDPDGAAPSEAYVRIQREALTWIKEYASI